jgi:hypothetical protein
MNVAGIVKENNACIAHIFIIKNKKLITKNNITKNNICIFNPQYRTLLLPGSPLPAV